MEDLYVLILYNISLWLTDRPMCAVLGDMSVCKSFTTARSSHSISNKDCLLTRFC